MGSREMFSQMAIIDQIAREKGTELVISKYDKYRQYSFYALALAALVLLIMFRWTEAVVVLALLHVHALQNQIWWKVQNIEHRMEAKKHV